MKHKRLLLLSVFLLLVIPFASIFAGDIPSRGEPADQVPGEVIIGFEPDTTSCQIKAIVSSIGGEIIGGINLPNAKIRRVRLSSPTHAARDEAIKSLRENRTYQGKIKYVEPNVILKIHRGMTGGDSSIQSQSGDPLLWDQWGYYDISANWINAPSAGKTIAVLDTGVDYNHPDLKGKVIKGKDFVNADGDPMDDHGHGTHVAGIAAAKANNSYGIAGVSWNSKILAVKVCNFAGSCTDFDVVKGIAYAADYPDVKVINMSLGGPDSSPKQDAVQYAVVTKKKLLVASAGNSGTSTPEYPAAYSVSYPGRVIAVAAHGDDGHGLGDHCKATFSNYGIWVSITAPGVDILSTFPPYLGYWGFGYMDGTSMAAPFVSGAAALAWAQYPTFTNTQIGNLITANTSAPTDTLVRDGLCWPNDGSTFERLDLVHMLGPDVYEMCDYGRLYGYVLNAETGEPLVDALVKTKQGTTISGKNYVPYWGIMTNPFFDSITTEGYGLFTVLTSPGGQNNDLIIKKNKFAKVKLEDLFAPSCSGAYAGHIPVPPNKNKYWLAVTWDYGYSGTEYDAYLYVPDYGFVYYNNRGAINETPYAKYFWDSWDWSGTTLRAFSEVIRIKKTVSGSYFFYIEDWITGAGSTTWSASGIKVYIYKWDAATAKLKLVKTYTPPAGAGQYWDICTISGNKITDINNLTD